MKKIRLLGLGISLYDTLPEFENDCESWGLQYTWKTHKLTRAFVMDDEDWIVAKNNTIGRSITDEINSYDFPVYVSKPWGSLNRWVEYPLEHVLSCFPNLKHRVLKKTDQGEEWAEIQGKYFMNSFCYMLALAIFEQFERIEIYGMDMATMSNRAPNETWDDERNCVNYWIGIAIGRGIEVVVPKDSRLTKPISPKNPSLYGYQVSEDLQKIRNDMLEKNNVLQRAIHSGRQEYMQGNDRIIDLTKSGITFDVYHKEDMPDNVKAGDIVIPRALPYSTINQINTNNRENIDEKISIEENK